jgi:hypothetical protein
MIVYSGLFHLTQPADRLMLRLWSPPAMTSANKMVKIEGIPVYRAAKPNRVLLTTFRDRVDNRIFIDFVKSGPSPVLSLDEEAKNLTTMSSV